MVAVQQFSVYLGIQVHHLAGLGADEGDFIQRQLAGRTATPSTPIRTTSSMERSSVRKEPSWRA